jgi:hypothetical protein
MMIRKEIQMSDNLFERLTDLSIGTGSQTPLAAIDRIKELEAKLAKVEAKLAKAVKLMELSVELATWDTTLLEDVIDFITELKWQDDE